MGKTALKRQPCRYPMNLFYNFVDEIPENVRVSDILDCIDCPERKCDVLHCLITDAIQDFEQ